MTPIDPIATWRPTRHLLDPSTATRLADSTRALVSTVSWTSPTNAKLACGHIFRYLAWLDTQTNQLPDERSANAYLQHLRNLDTPRGTLSPIRAALNRCLSKSTNHPPAPPPATAAETIETYTPNAGRIAPDLWTAIAASTRDAVTTAGPTDRNQATSLLVPASLYLAWAASVDTDSDDLFAPQSVHTFGSAAG